jgi:hypothetical protein
VCSGPPKAVRLPCVLPVMGRITPGPDRCAAVSMRRGLPFHTFVSNHVIAQSRTGTSETPCGETSSVIALNPAGPNRMTALKHAKRIEARSYGSPRWLLSYRERNAYNRTGRVTSGPDQLAGSHGPGRVRAGSRDRSEYTTHLTYPVTGSRDLAERSVRSVG